MFFKKIHKQPENINNVILEQPIYILGNNELALFLAAKFQENGQQSILLTPSAPSQGYKENIITLKEEYNLQKKDINILSTSYLQQQPAAILISCPSNSLRSHLTLLPQKHYPNTPIICFNFITDIETIRPLLGTAFYKAYFQGYLCLSGTNLTACGMMPEILLSQDKEQEGTHPTEPILKQTGLPVLIQNKDSYNFWKHNAPKILGYLSTNPKQHITELLNNPSGKEQLTVAASEICRLAKYEKIKLSTDELLRLLWDTPRNFYYKTGSLNKIEDAAKLEKLYNMLSEKARIYKCKIPELNRLIKKNYENLHKK